MSKIIRKPTKKVRVGNIFIGGSYPIAVQSMTTTPTSDVTATVNQIKQLEDAGCDIVRVGVPDMASAQAIGDIKKSISIPLVADIHFDYNLALTSIKNGVDKIRINPGNIKDIQALKKIAQAAAERDIVIRIGVNSGSLDKHLLKQYQRPTAEAMVQSALNQASLLENFNFENIVFSIKSSDVIDSVEAYEMLSGKTHYPLHVGITEAGTWARGLVKSSVGIGTLLHKGIGDTIRVSLTDNPLKEVLAGVDILKSLRLRGGLNLISCPTCARCRNKNFIDTVCMLEQELLSYRHLDVTIAIMGCEVNGPGEAKDADFGVAMGNDKCAVFENGKIVRSVAHQNILQEVLRFCNNSDHK